MPGSEAQPYHTLRARPGFITGGGFARPRTPNHLGEIMGASPSRHPGWREWRARTGLLFPRLRPPAGAT